MSHVSVTWYDVVYLRKGILEMNNGLTHLGFSPDRNILVKTEIYF